MHWDGLLPSDRFLGQAAFKYFVDNYEKPLIKIVKEIDPKLGWRPSLHFKLNDHLTVVAEVSEVPYPEIFRLRHAEILNVHMPISIYCICPEEAYLQESKQSDVRDLRSHGYGLLTVDRESNVTNRFGCIPLIQHLPEEEFKSEIKGLPKKILLSLKEAFESYKQNPGSGVKTLSEIVEGLVINSAKKMAAKSWISKGAVKGNIVDILDEMANAKSCKNALAAIGGARSYISEYRNTSHHIPKNKKQAYKKYQDCLHGFREGIKKIQSFRDALKNIGINI